MLAGEPLDHDAVPAVMDVADGVVGLGGENGEIDRVRRRVQISHADAPLTSMVLEGSPISASASREARDRRRTTTAQHACRAAASRRTRLAADAALLVAQRLEELGPDDKLPLERTAAAIACAGRHRLVRNRRDGSEPDSRSPGRLDHDLLASQCALDEKGKILLGFL